MAAIEQRLRAKFTEPTLPNYQQLLQPFEAAAIRAYVVSKLVNSPANNVAEGLAPAAAGEAL